LTPDQLVAEHFARQSAQTDLEEERGDGTGIIISLSRAALDRAGYLLTDYSDAVWGDGACDWEKEIACWSPIILTVDLLICVDQLNPLRS
jgi:hypothetical protein